MPTSAKRLPYPPTRIYRRYRAVAGCVSVATASSTIPVLRLKCPKTATWTSDLLAGAGVASVGTNKAMTNVCWSKFRPMHISIIRVKPGRVIDRFASVAMSACCHRQNCIALGRYHFASAVASGSVELMRLCGKINENVLPSPGRLATFSVALCRAAMRLTIARPSPVPPVERDRALSTR